MTSIPVKQYSVWQKVSDDEYTRQAAQCVAESKR